MSVSYDKINPNLLYKDIQNPYFVPYSGVSTINMGLINVSSISGVQSINGLPYPLTTQSSATNPGSVSGLSVPPSAWTQLVSTPTNFTFVGGKLYDVQFPLGANITQASSNANQNISFGVGTPSMTVPANCYTVHTLATAPTQILASGLCRATIAPSTTTITQPLTAYVLTAGSGDNATISCGGGANSTTPFVVKQIN